MTSLNACSFRWLAAWHGLLALLICAIPNFANAKNHRHISDRSSAEAAQEPTLYSSAALVLDHDNGAAIYQKNIDSIHSIASLTKLLTAIVVLDSKLALDTTIRIENDDIDLERGSRSKMRIGEVLARRDMLRLALMASENRAASALARTFPGGRETFVAAMNRKAAQIGMTSSWFVDSCGLSRKNVSTARDVAKLVAAAARYELIREYSTTPQVSLTRLDSGTQINYLNTNLMLRRDTGWIINLSKTGYLNDAGYSLVLQAVIDGRVVDIVLLESYGRYSRVGDANRIKRWIEERVRPAMGKS